MTNSTDELNHTIPSLELNKIGLPDNSITQIMGYHGGIYGRFTPEEFKRRIIEVGGGHFYRQLGDSDWYLSYHVPIGKQSVILDKCRHAVIK